MKLFTLINELDNDQEIMIINNNDIYNGVVDYEGVAVLIKDMQKQKDGMITKLFNSYEINKIAIAAQEPCLMIYVNN
jgi:hypothetical protein